MPRIVNMMAAVLFAAIAAASLIGLATAAPEGERVQSDACKNAFCLVAFF
ncbi:MAG: hypothetical protein ACX939_11940 [Hyphococcus sp.]